MPDEQIFYNSEYGFFTYWVDYKKKRLVIPKMVGNGKFLRHVIFDMVRELEPLGFREILCCSRRRPEVYLRVLGGKLDHIETSVNLNTGKEEPMYFYIVSLDDTKEASKDDDKINKP